MTYVPVVFVKLQLDQLSIALLRQIECGQRARLAECHFVDATARAMGAVTVVTLSKVVPVAKKHSAIRAVFLPQAPKPIVIR